MSGKMPLAGARVLVTGGGSGFGRLLACGAAQRGAAEVVVWDRSAELGEGTAAIIRAHGAAARALTVDVTDQAGVARAGEETGPIDVVINNAGVHSSRLPLLDDSPESIERTLQVNLASLFWVTRAFLPGLIARDRGTVVTIASASGLIAPARMTAYAASKFGAFGFNEALRHELRLQGSHINTLVVAPFYMNTASTAKATTRFPFLLPVLRPTRLAAAVLNAVESGRPLLVAPRFVNSVTLLRVLPVPALDWLADFFGINGGRADAVGRPR